MVVVWPCGFLEVCIGVTNFLMEFLAKPLHQEGTPDMSARIKFVKKDQKCGHLFFQAKVLKR